jgi:hypothetical protein
MTRRQAPAAYRCGAGVNHYDKPSKIEAWKRAEQERAAGQVADKVRAHDDYMDAVRLFRSRTPQRDNVQDRRNAGFEADVWFNGYEQAVRDMDSAIVDAIRARQDEEEHR